MFLICSYVSIRCIAKLLSYMCVCVYIYMHVCTYTLDFFSMINYYKILSIVPWLYS